MEIKIGKKLTVTRYFEDGFEEREVDIDDYKECLDPDGPCSQKRIYEELKEILDGNVLVKDEDLREVSKKVNPIIWEALRNEEIKYTADYIDTLLNNERESKIDIVYDENQYENRNIFDKIKGLPFIRKGLNKKETEIIGRWAYKDVEKSKIARKIPKRDKKAEKLNAPDPKTLNGHSEFVKRLEQMSKITEDPDKDKAPRDIEKENVAKAKKQIEQSDDYLDRF